MSDPNQPARIRFKFYECIILIMPTGKKAVNLREFAELLKVVSPRVISHHLHQFFIKPVHQPRDCPNDFAHWAASGLEDFKLAEKLSNLAPFRFSDIEDLREALVDIIEDHMWESPIIPWARPGSEFFFNESTTVVTPTGIEAKNLTEFENALIKVNTSSIYYHFFESRQRLHQDVDDFSFWIENNFDCPNLVRQIRNIDFYLYSLLELRERIIQILELELSNMEK
jgi:hypothetical protein